MSVQHRSSKRSIEVVDQQQRRFEAIHGLGVMEEPNNKAKDKDCAEGELNKRKGNVLEEYQVDNGGFR